MVKYFSILRTEIIQHEIIVSADNAIQADARATVGPFEKVAEKSNTISVKRTPCCSTLYSGAEEIPASLYHDKMPEFFPPPLE